MSTTSKRPTAADEAKADEAANNEPPVDEPKTVEAKGDRAGVPWRDERTLRIAAPPEQVYRAWADPEILSHWFPDEARGEAVPGGELVHVWRDFGMELHHRVLEATPNQRLLLEGKNPAGFPFLQEILIERQENETVLRLVHSGFGPDADLSEELEGVDSGWKMALALLRHYLENHFGVARTSSALIVKPASFDWERAARCFREQALLAGWLTEAGAIGDVGEVCDLALRGGGKLSGEVLAVTGREVAVSWRELPGVLELKAFAAGPDQQMIGARLSAWGTPAERLEPALAGLGEAVERLAAAV